MFPYGKLFGLVSLIGAAALARSSAQERALPEGVIHIALPAGTFSIENIVRKGKPLLRFGVGKTVTEARTIFLGDGKGVHQIEAIQEGMHWIPAKGGKGFVYDGLQIYEPGTTVAAKDYLRVDNMKAGSVYVTAPTIRFFWWPDAPQKPKPARERPALPDGVIHVALPPGEVHVERVVRNGDLLLRVSVGRHYVVQARTIFLGDFKGATQYEAIKEGVHHVPAKGGQGFISDPGWSAEGSSIGAQDFLTLDQLKAGSVFVTTPSITFLWGAAAKVKP